MADERMAVVGAGLVGSLMALFLARRGRQVTVFERRADMRRGGPEEGRSINLAISERGLSALRQVGLEAEALGHAIPMRGRMMHPVEGRLAFQAYGKDDTQCIHSISRGLLNRMLMDAAERAGVELRFGHRLTSVDWEKGTGYFSTPSENGVSDSRKVACPLLGADGAGSVLRQEMLKLPGYSSGQETLSHGYKELTLPAAPGGGFALEKHALHIWPRRAFMLIALPNEDGSFTCTLFLPFEGPQSFSALDNPARVEAFFQAEFPDVVPLLPDFVEQFFSRPTGHMVTVKAGPWSVGDKAVLLGDAAHAIVPFYGQGMNCGFEDCVALDALLARLPGAEAFAAFYQERKPNADAISDMAVDNFVEMRDRVADPRFLLQKEVEKRLLNAFPGTFLSRYTLVSFSRAPYRFAQGVGARADAILRTLTAGLTRAEDVDLERAGRLIEEQLVPYLKESGYGPGAER